MTNAWFVNGIQTTLGTTIVSMIGINAEDKSGRAEEENKAFASLPGYPVRKAKKPSSARLTCRPNRRDREISSLDLRDE